MPSSTLSGISLAGITCAVPKRKVGNDFFKSLYDEKTIKNIEKMTGIISRRYVADGMCSSDLCFAAAENLLKKLNWSADSIDMLVYLTQTPDYLSPGTASDLQARLGLPSTCAVFDVNLSCSGYVYGLWICSNFIAANGYKRVLFLNGDIYSIDRYGRNYTHRSTAQLFGDAGAATALEYDSSATPINFILGADGSGLKNLYAPAGGYRNYSTESTKEQKVQPDGSKRSEEDLHLNGTEIFNFAVERVPESLNLLREKVGGDYDKTDYFLLHQANKFIIDYLINFLKLDPARVPISIAEFGNTSSASIPLTMVTQIAEQLTKKSNRITMAGFGSGYTWATAHAQIKPLKVADLIEI